MSAIAYPSKVIILEPPKKKTKERKYLTEQEEESLIKAVRKNSRHALRDETLITMMVRHGLRVSEAINLKWEQIDFKKGVIHIFRLKNGDDSVQPIPGLEMRLLRRLEREPNKQRHIFISNRGAPLTRITVIKMIALMGKYSGMPFPIHPHMLRHTCGYRLANKGIDLRLIQMYLGHKNIANTVIYTKLASDKFKGIWRD